MIKTLLNPNHVLSDCDNLVDIDAQRMAAVLGKHLYGFKKGEEKPIVKVLGLDANDDVRWSASSVPGGGLPPSTPEDEGKVLVVGDDGEPEWADLPTGGDIAYSVDRASQASWDVDTLYASTQFYITDGGDNGGVEYYLDGQDRKAGYRVLEGHVYQVNFNCKAVCASTSGNVWEGSVYITGPQDQNWYFQLDGSQAIDVSLTGSTVIHCSSDSVLSFNARLNGSYLGSLPTMSLAKVSIVDLTSAIGGGSGGTEYRAGEGINISDDTISVDTTEIQEKLTAGSNITISNGIISAANTEYQAGHGLTLSNNTFAVDDTVLQGKLTAGANVQISGNTISATDTTYTAGSNVQISSGNVISATDTTYTAGSGLALNGTEFSNTAPNVKADWDAAAGSDAEILNKPTIPVIPPFKELVAGSGITITEGTDTVTIASNGGSGGGTMAIWSGATPSGVWVSTSTSLSTVVTSLTNMQDIYNSPFTSGEMLGVLKGTSAFREGYMYRIMMTSGAIVQGQSGNGYVLLEVKNGSTTIGSSRCTVNNAGSNVTIVFDVYIPTGVYNATLSMTSSNIVSGTWWPTVSITAM